MDLTLLLIFLYIYLIVVIFAFMIYLLLLKEPPKKFWTPQEIRMQGLKKEIKSRQEILERTDDPKIQKAVKKTLEENYKELEELNSNIVGVGFTVIGEKNPPKVVDPKFYERMQKIKENSPLVLDIIDTNDFEEGYFEEDEQKMSENKTYEPDERDWLDILLRTVLISLLGVMIIACICIGYLILKMTFGGS